MLRMRELLLSIFLSSISASVLNVKGKSSEIRIGLPENQAVLTSSCEAAAPGVIHSYPNTFDHLGHGATNDAVSVDVYLVNVAASCTAVSDARVPCAKHDKFQGWPDLFYCVWNGSQDEETTGPVSASFEEDVSGAGTVLGGSTKVSCPVPENSAIRRISGTSSSDETHVELTLSIRHFKPSGSDALDFEFVGPSAENKITLEYTPFPPPSAPVPAPPPSPAPSPPPPPPSPAFVTVNAPGYPQNRYVTSYCPQGTSYIRHACGSNAETAARTGSSAQWGPYSANEYLTSGGHCSCCCNCNNVWVHCG